MTTHKPYSLPERRDISHDLVELQAARKVLDDFAATFGRAIRPNLNTETARGAMSDCSDCLDDLLKGAGADTLDATIKQLEGRLDDLRGEAL